MERAIFLNPDISARAVCRAAANWIFQCPQCPQVVLVGGWYDQLDPSKSIATVMAMTLADAGVSRETLFSRETLGLNELQPPRDLQEEVWLLDKLLGRIPNPDLELHIFCLAGDVGRARRLYAQIGLHPQFHGVWSWELTRWPSQLAASIAAALAERSPAVRARLERKLSAIRQQRTLDNKQYDPLEPT